MVSAVLDHVVVNVMGRIDEGFEQYKKLGFQMTDRGHHSLGSSNHLAIFGTNYLELLGCLPGMESLRPDLANHPLGLSGIVFKGTEPVALHQALEASGVRALEPLHFHRMVEVEGGEKEARFAITRVSPEQVQNGRVYFCTHATPELVYRPEWQTHPNKVTNIAEFVIVAVDASKTASLYQRMFGADQVTATPGGYRVQNADSIISILSCEAARARFGAALPELTPGEDRMVALVVQSAAMEDTRRVLAGNGVGFSEFETGILVKAADAGNMTLAFIPS